MPISPIGNKKALLYTHLSARFEITMWALTSHFPSIVSEPSTSTHHPPLGGPLCPLALLTVALPLANPTPRPLVPLDRNMGAFLLNIFPLVQASAYPRTLLRVILGDQGVFTVTCPAQ